ncbi:C39 family peptidase [Nocardia sp. NPDC127579]|uniref:C39 family peptidase n=1 Tax=Nocardia sp. NPDC127579 TaxID=3345402 RepID=UPI00362AA971
MRGTLAAAALGALGVAAACSDSADTPTGTSATRTGPAPARPGVDLAYRGWRTGSELADGDLDGTVAESDAVVFDRPTGTLEYNGTRYEYATWTSPEVEIDFSATELVESWTARTPGKSWIQLELQAVTDRGDTTGWYNLGRWAADDNEIRRASVDGQDDANGQVVQMAYVTDPGVGLRSYRVRALLLRPVDGTDRPALTSLGVVAGPRPDKTAEIALSEPGPAKGKILDVPRYSQLLHLGEYPEWGGGGEAWCSPTSTSMVLAYWKAGPKPEDYAWVVPTTDPVIDFAARNCYDYTYRGTGNWSFCTAYAGRWGVNAFVTRLRDLREAEEFIAAGIPLVMSIAFEPGEVPGLNYSTDGHLLVLVGFTADGDPVLNDPAAPTNDAVRKVAGRREFETHWQRFGVGGVYVIHPPSVPLPEPPEPANW